MELKIVNFLLADDDQLWQWLELKILKRKQLPFLVPKWVSFCRLLQLLSFILGDFLAQGSAAHGDWRHLASVSPCVPYEWSSPNEISPCNSTLEGMFLEHSTDKFLCDCEP